MVALSLLVAAASGCGRTANQGPPDASAGGTGGVANPGSSGDSATAGGGGDAACEAPRAAAAPLGMLTDHEISRSARHALGDPTPALGTRELYAGMDTALEPSFELVRALRDRARAAALRVTQPSERLLTLLDCDPEGGDAVACREHFLERFLRRAYRRPVIDEDRAEMTAVFERGQELGGDFASGARAVVEVALQSPDFLYLVERGGPEKEGDATRLTAHELAARLSFLLTGAPPDDELAGAADNGLLDDVARRKHALRLLGTEPNRRQVSEIYQGWYDLAPAQPALNASLAAAAAEESRRFIADVTFDGAGTFRALLTEPSTWLNEPLAELYGVTEVRGDEFRKVQLDPARRAGLFTQPAFLGVGSVNGRVSPTRRGLALLSKLLCTQVEPPPDGVQNTEPVLGPTRRATLELSTADAACQTCHRAVDGAGFPFENYDAEGRYLETENGVTIDASGELFVGDAAGKVENAVQMLARLAESEVAQGCFATHWLEQARRRAITTEDACALATVKRAFIDSGGHVPTLMLELATSPELGLRPSREIEP